MAASPRRSSWSTPADPSHDPAITGPAGERVAVGQLQLAQHGQRMGFDRLDPRFDHCARYPPNRWVGTGRAHNVDRILVGSHSGRIASGRNGAGRRSRGHGLPWHPCLPTTSRCSRRCVSAATSTTRNTTCFAGTCCGARRCPRPSPPSRRPRKFRRRRLLPDVPHRHRHNRGEPSGLPLRSRRHRRSNQHGGR